MVNDGTLNSIKFSSVLSIRYNPQSELNYKGSNYTHSRSILLKTPFLFQLAFLQFKDIYGLQIKASKITNAALSKVYSTTHLLNEMIEIL
jgi:hypothetical protein